MKFTEKVTMDIIGTFGTLEFLGHDGERTKAGEDNQSVVLNQRYGLSSSAQEGTVVIYLPADKKLSFDYDTEVTLVNPTISAFATATYNAMDVITQIFADDIIPVAKNQTNTSHKGKEAN
ncbi:DUF961 domain-containing protein [Listeria monocytogenes]|uniref:DUF961 family protein n=1 Tax=Listeria monocytogenes TaxID=1639 RepID=UPI000874F981|nr:DUF961 family protein [Listeria monocytogenes]EAD9483307.1 DUF961 domain-containing protein [Listeria monocytogenes]EAE5673646.1 DUF961 domain-containing protein [Listeria monocytogenes]EAG0962326.1 DUF961 domain-containing protein [Listeria monocytogenes]EAG0969840.1 DUF961 domain-containing protein [Listeria monocytogenes]EAG0986822.1 DUF961 domain-containing protein [Listeria monocytogenes]